MVSMEVWIKFRHSSNKEGFLINPLWFVHVTKVVRRWWSRRCPLHVVLYFVLLHLPLKYEPTPPQPLLLPHVRLHQRPVVLRKIGPTAPQWRFFKLEFFFAGSYFGTGSPGVCLWNSVEVGDCFLLLEVIIKADFIKIIELIGYLSGYFDFTCFLYPVDEQF